MNNLHRQCKNLYDCMWVNKSRFRDQGSCFAFKQKRASVSKICREVAQVRMKSFTISIDAIYRYDTNDIFRLQPNYTARKCVHSARYQLCASITALSTQHRIQPSVWRLILPKDIVVIAAPRIQTMVLNELMPRIRCDQESYLQSCVAR